MFINSWRDKHILVHLFNRLLYDNKKNELLSHATTWMDFTNIMWSEEGKARHKASICYCSICIKTNRQRNGSVRSPDSEHHWGGGRKVSMKGPRGSSTERWVHGCPLLYNTLICTHLCFTRYSENAALKVLKNRSSFHQYNIVFFSKICKWTKFS